MSGIYSSTRRSTPREDMVSFGRYGGCWNPGLRQPIGDDDNEVENDEANVSSSTSSVLPSEPTQAEVGTSLLEDEAARMNFVFQPIVPSRHVIGSTYRDSKSCGVTAWKHAVPPQLINAFMGTSWSHTAGIPQHEITEAHLQTFRRGSCSGIRALAAHAHSSPTSALDLPQDGVRCSIRSYS